MENYFFHHFLFFFLILPRTPISTLFPYTTLFRSFFLCGPPPFMEAARRILTEIGVERERIRQERSEEHTSELQSPYDLVCRLLLEKKKSNQQILHILSTT